MTGIIGLGGVFVTSRDRKALAQWYRDKLGLDLGEQFYRSFGPFAPPKPKHGFQVFSLFEAGSDYMAPSTRDMMVNFIVEDLAVYVEEIKARGVDLVGDIVDEPYGRFAWILDPDGTKIELWEPKAPDIPAGDI